MSQDNGTPRRLQKGVLSVPNGIALAAAAMAPVLAVVLNAPAAAPVAGSAIPLSFLIAFIACAFVGNTVVQFARRLPSAGSFYTFNSRGLGPAAGFFTGWLFWIGYAVLAPGLFTAFGAFVHDYVAGTFNTDVPWWIFSLMGMVLVFGLSARSIKASVRVDLLLLGIEVVIFLVLGLVAIAKAGPGNSAVFFSPSSSPTGVSGVGLGVVFGILSFIGFDAAATLGEETRDPRRNVPRAVMGALGAVGVFYVFEMYALAAGYGLNSPSKLAAFLQDPNPFVTLSDRVTPWLSQPVQLAAIAGLFSCFLAIVNTTVRVMFSMGRDQVLPRSLGSVHPTWHSPLTAIVVQTVFTVVIGLGVGAWLGPGPTGAYGFTGAIGTVAIVVVYLASNIALIRYFWKDAERSVLKHVVLPALGVVALAYPLYAVAQPGQSYPYNLVLPIVIIWVVLGLALFLRYRAVSPDKIAALGSFLAEDDVPLDEQPEALLGARASSLQEPTVDELDRVHPHDDSGRA
ncbi:APC family permease [Phycicoccus duodecadis]|uniref:Amino acid/polyamine/organocation transporter (APC superfamily) n=1 Tax=Phycicoccus duodecadis TaxID=173053 RepID=A0A2N3YJ04_9MICO|nr:APC family permease [Phycicoccus duodecadis]PKW26823.1 amino acid/polyamine/organocation transporter (APC superfamily) [Phycicoccus duodecadis]